MKTSTKRLLTSIAEDFGISEDALTDVITEYFVKSGGYKDFLAAADQFNTLREAHPELIKNLSAVN